ncbi:uncharacterized protein C9orf43 homolog [Anolis sagrei]|uniref:uncharacterized protein C9orf43 homolog n=1 Tax=Anolis sagrei TaxID=38937 RepID=UPI003521C873
MVGVDTKQWDETICDMMPCQHPLCWETLRRIESGHPRIVLGALASPERESPDCEGELPTLKIIDLPLNCPQKQGVKCSKSYSSVSKTVSRTKDTRSYFSNCTPNDTWIPPVSVMSSERNPFPGLNSRMDSHTPHLSPFSFSCSRQLEQIQVMDISELAAQRLGCQLPYGNLVVQWIPSKWPSRLQSKKSPVKATASQRMCVKDLALESTLSFKDNQVKRRKKSSKVPTGGQPYLLHLRRKKRVPTDNSSPLGKGEEATDGALRTSQLSFCSLPLTPLASPRKEVNPEMNSRKAASTEIKKKVAPPVIVLQKAPSLYRFEAKFPVKERCSRGIRGQLRVPPEGSGLLWHSISDLVDKPGCTEAPDPRKGGDGRGGGSHGDQPDKVATLIQEASAEEGPPPLAPIAPPERKKSVRFAECKNNTARVPTEGGHSVLPRILRMESKFCRYRRQMASWREPPPQLAPPAPAPPPQDPAPPSAPTDSPQGTPRESPRLLLSPNPPPPPPSPFFSLSSENSSLD